MPSLGVQRCEEATERPLYRFENSRGIGYCPAMQRTVPPKLPPLLGIVLFTMLAAALVAAVAGWNMFGTSILFTYAQNGLAWCL